MNQLNSNISAYAHQLRTRICGICIKENKLLLVKHQATINNTSFWAPPGGALNLGEKVTECLKREMKEETGLYVKPGRFLFLNEFLQPPLHALEYFFEVSISGGELLQGTDPEAENQIIEEVKFLSLPEINKIPLSDKHRILHHLYSLDDLFGMDNRFLQ